MDLLTYLKNYEPNKLVRVSDNTYCTREHDSLKISKGKWCWFSKDIGGKSALDYLINVEGYSFVSAVGRILGYISEQPPVSFYSGSEDEPEKLYMQALNSSTDRVEAYLRFRGIHEVVIRFCIENKLLFETAGYHSALFVGYDKDGRMRYAAQRGVVTDFKGENAGSDKRFGFRIDGIEDSNTLHVFESAIDLLSFASIIAYEGGAWRLNPMLSTGGVYKAERKDTVPMALQHYLDEHPNITKIHLHLDNDETGRNAALGIVESLENNYTVFDEPPAEGKDVNDWLNIKLRQKGRMKNES